MVHEAAGGWGLKPGGVALAKACTRIFQPDGKEYLRRWLTYQTEKHSEEYYRRIFHKSGYLMTPHGDASSTFADASEHISPKIYRGGIIPTESATGYGRRLGLDGIVVIGHFGCLPTAFPRSDPQTAQHPTRPRFDKAMRVPGFIW